MCVSSSLESFRLQKHSNLFKTFVSFIRKIPSTKLRHSTKILKMNQNSRNFGTKSFQPVFNFSQNSTAQSHSAPLSECNKVFTSKYLKTISIISIFANMSLNITQAQSGDWYQYHLKESKIQQERLMEKSKRFAFSKHIKFLFHQKFAVAPPNSEVW